jgi:hypothetical protein
MLLPILQDPTVFSVQSILPAASPNNDLVSRTSLQAVGMALAPRARKHANTPGKKNILFKSGFHKVGPSFQFQFEFWSNHEQSFLGDQKFGCPKQAASIPQSLAQTLHSPSWDPPGSKRAASQGEMVLEIPHFRKPQFNGF